MENRTSYLNWKKSLEVIPMKSEFLKKQDIIALLD